MVLAERRPPHVDLGHGAPMVPAYYWAGHGSAVIHRLKGFDIRVDDREYAKAYDADHIRWLARAGVNLLFLSYNWGLPPEVEQQDWQSFEDTAALAHQAGMRVAAYIQPSNAAFLGSNRKRPWWALTPAGKRIPYYNGRYFTCMNNPAWRSAVRERAVDAIKRGADALFLDNCCFGGMPIPFGDNATGFAGCACIRCQASFGQWLLERGRSVSPIPFSLRPGATPVSRAYADWRADVVLGLLREVRSVAAEAGPDVAIVTNTFGAASVDAFTMFGVDLARLAETVDWLFVENLQSPGATDRLLVQNAGTFKALQAVKPGAPVLSIAYQRGTGVDGVPSPRVFRRAAAEGFASGGTPVLRAGEYVVRNQWRLLDPVRHRAHVEAWSTIAEFVAGHPAVFEGRRPAAAAALLLPATDPVERLDLSAVTRVAQSLVCAGIPFRVISEGDDLDGVGVVIGPPAMKRLSGHRAWLIYDDVVPPVRARGLFSGSPALEPIVRRLGPAVLNAYYQRAVVRKAADRFDALLRLVVSKGSKRVTIPPAAEQVLRDASPFAVRAEAPIYVDVWRAPATASLHLVNYTDDDVRVDIRGWDTLGSRLLKHRGDTSCLRGSTLILDGYAVLASPRQTPGSGAS